MERAAPDAFVTFVDHTMFEMIDQSELTHPFCQHSRVLTFYTEAVTVQQASGGGEASCGGGLIRFRHSGLMLEFMFSSFILLSLFVLLYFLFLFSRPF